MQIQYNAVVTHYIIVYNIHNYIIILYIILVLILGLCQIVLNREYDFQRFEI